MSKKFSFYFLLAALMSGVSFAGSSYREIRDNINFHVDGIHEREKAVSRALREALSANVGEFEKWRALDREVQNYLNTVDGSTSVIDQQVRRLVAENPGRPLPSIEISDPFARHIGPTEARIQEIRRAELEVDQRIAYGDRIIAEVDEAIINATQEAVGEVVKGFLPDERGLVGGGSVVLFSAYFGPAGIATGVLAVGITSVVNQFVGVYNTTSSLTEQEKILSDFLRVLRERRDALEWVKESYQPALQEMRMIEHQLNIFREAVNERRNNLDRMIEGWREKVDKAGEEKKQEEMEAYQEERQTSSALGPNRQYYFWRGSSYGSGPLAVPSADEVRRSADSILAPVLSAYERVSNGGAEMEFFNEAVRNALSEADAPQPNNSRHRDLRRSFNNNKSTATARTLFNYEQNLLKRRAVHASVLDGARRLREMIRKRKRFVQEQFVSEVNTLSEQVLLAEVNYRDTLRSLYPLNIGRIEIEINSLNNRQENAIRSGTSPLSWQASLEGLLERIKNVENLYLTLRPDVDDTWHEYQRTLSNAVRELDHFLHENRSLINAEIVGNMQYHIYPGSSVKRAWRKMEGLRRGVIGRHRPPPPPSPPPFNTWKNEVTALRGAVTSSAAGDAGHRSRLRQAELRINRELVPFANFRLDTRRPPVTELIQEKAPMSRLASRIDETVPERYRRTPGHFLGLGVPRTWESMHVRERLLTALRALENYLPGFFQYDQESGTVTRFNSAGMQNLLSVWEALDPLLADFEADAAPLRDQALELRDLIAGEREALENALSREDDWIRRSTEGSRSWRSFIGNCTQVETLLETYAGYFNPIDDTFDLDGLEGSFAVYNEFIRQREEARQRREEERRRREEEEERRREEERAAAAAAERERQERLNKVQDFYERFARNYSRRDLTAVIRMLDSNWSAEDGSTILDLEETLDNSFRVFDEVECQISNVRVISHEDNVVRVQYTINITGHIYRNRIRHEENSQVSEKVRLDNGRTVILRTLGGQFW